MEAIITYLDQWFVHGTISGTITILFFLLAAVILNKAMNSIIRRRWSDHAPVPHRIKKTILIVFITYGVLTQITPLQSLATTLLASGGILAVIVGLASQEAAANMINGMMIYFGKPFKVGDMIVLKEHNLRGKVIDISLRHSIMETLEKTQIIIPNTIMNKAIIENVSNVPNKKANHLFIDISYESNMEKAIAIIQEEAMHHPFFIDPRNKKDKKNTPAVAVHCLEFKDSGIALRATIYSQDNEHGFEMLSDLRKSIKLRFDQEGIEIPYPHQTIVYKQENSN